MNSIFSQHLWSILATIAIFNACQSTTQSRKLHAERKYAEVVLRRDTLFSSPADSAGYGDPRDYVDSNGLVVIPKNTFSQCFTDTFVTFAYVVDAKKYGNRMVAINRNLEVIFDAFLFDNGPDYLSDDLFRIEQNGKIGYANSLGEVVIEPQYKCAYPFEDGRARVATECEISSDGEHSSWSGSRWFYIDKTGRRLAEGKRGGSGDYSGNAAWKAHLVSDFKIEPRIAVKKF